MKRPKGHLFEAGAVPCLLLFGAGAVGEPSRNEAVQLRAPVRVHTVDAGGLTEALEPGF